MLIFLNIVYCPTKRVLSVILIIIIIMIIIMIIIIIVVVIIMIIIMIIMIIIIIIFIMLFRKRCRHPLPPLQTKPSRRKRCTLLIQ